MHPTISRFISSPTSKDVAAVQALYGMRMSRPSKCKPNQFYCGRDLIQMGYKNPDLDSLYECTSSGNIAFLQYCSRGCLRSARDQPFCACTIGLKYCGHELRLQNFGSVMTISDHTLYHCDRPEVPTKLEVCPARCESRLGDSECVIGTSRCAKKKFYCGYEISSLKIEDLNRHALYQCTGGSASNLTVVETCEYGCATNGTSPYCRHGLGSVWEVMHD